VAAAGVHAAGTGALVIETLMMGMSKRTLSCGAQSNSTNKTVILIRLVLMLSKETRYFDNRQKY
jgi:hypothetical protein